MRGIPPSRFSVDVRRITKLLSPFSKLVQTVHDKMRQLNRQADRINFFFAYSPVGRLVVKCVRSCSQPKLCVWEIQSIFSFVASFVQMAHTRTHTALSPTPSTSAASPLPKLKGIGEISLLLFTWICLFTALQRQA